MGSKWRKVKLALGLNMCVYSSRNHVADNDDDEDFPPPSERRSDAALLSPPGDWATAPSTPSSNRLRFSKSLSRSSSKAVLVASDCAGDKTQVQDHLVFNEDRKIMSFVMFF